MWSIRSPAVKFLRWRRKAKKREPLRNPTDDNMRAQERGEPVRAGPGDRRRGTRFYDKGRHLDHHKSSYPPRVPEKEKNWPGAVIKEEKITGTRKVNDDREMKISVPAHEFKKIIY